MIDLAEFFQALPLAEALRRSRWIYPLVNAGHILGIALLVGSVVPMGIAVLRYRDMPGMRPYAIFGLLLVATTGALLFTVQASEYILNSWIRLKFMLLALAMINVVVHLTANSAGIQRSTAFFSLLLWPSILICGRLVGFS